MAEPRPVPRETLDPWEQAVLFALERALRRDRESIEVTPAAERRGLVLALPTTATTVGGTGALRRPGTQSWPLVIAHRDSWLRASRTA